MLDINLLLRNVVEAGASDLHLAAANPPVVRVNGALKMVQGGSDLTQQDLEQVLDTVAPARSVAAFKEDKELDVSYELPGVARFRINACYQRGTISLSLRVLAAVIPTPEELGLPASCLRIVERQISLVLVTGPTGSGKSTTLAALLNHINSNVSCRIITLEDPIEFVHHNKKSMVIQRELGGDTHSFSESLKRALRQDPDVIMVGEMRDADTVSLALAAAETGHLVLGTLHTNGAPESIERIVGIMPADQQAQAQFQLSIGLTSVAFQSLIPRASGQGRVAAFEIMSGTPAVRNLIRQNQINQIRSYMFMGAQYGMQTLDQALAALMKEGTITQEEAFARTPDRATLEKLMELEGIPLPPELKGSLGAAARSGVFYSILAVRRV